MDAPCARALKDLANTEKYLLMCQKLIQILSPVVV